MSAGLGLALLGIWLVVAAAFSSRQVSSAGVWIALTAAISMTLYLTKTYPSL